MIPMRVHNASHSSIEWVVRISEHFSRFVTMSVITCIIVTTKKQHRMKIREDFYIGNLSGTCHMKRLATGSMPVLGSSKNTIEGSPIIAIATLSLRLLPPL